MKQEQKLSEIVAAWERGETIQLCRPSDGTWVDLGDLHGPTTFNTRRVYRVKPDTIKIGGREVPRPLTSLNGLESAWVVDLYGGHPYEAFKYEFHRKVIELGVGNGLVHSNMEAAIKHSEALIEFNKEAVK